MLLSEPVTLPNGKVIDKCVPAGDLVYYELLPFGIELELYGAFAPEGEKHDVLYDGSNTWLDRLIIGEDTYYYEFQIADANYDVPL